jgi:hypothetical protein
VGKVLTREVKCGADVTPNISSVARKISGFTPPDAALVRRKTARSWAARKNKKCPSVGNFAIAAQAFQRSASFFGNTLNLRGGYEYRIKIS